MTLSTNPQIELAYNYVQYTRQNIFLTGKAGTGKTTFLRRVKAETIKRTAVVAPTGVAAINAGGMTIHSFFQLPFGLFLPNNKQEANRKRKVSKQKINLFRSLDLLIIDEISMVRADVLDAIDDVLRRYRNPRIAFGGVQLLMIGDLHQLPPVVRHEDWDLLKEHYETPYFFGSLALKETHPVTVKLTHIYRQSDDIFINLLNKVRNNQMDQDVLDALNSRYIPNFQPTEEEGYITLASHNRMAQAINQEKLKALNKPIFTFRAALDGDFPERNYPTAEKLELKEGAQVLFVKNDNSAEKRYYNGKIGQVVELKKDFIRVKCADEAPFTVYQEEWRNVKYTLNEATKEVEEEVIGLFTQYPLKLAWAITIHKSQGLTFEKAIIDAQSAFAHGQVYVALSRCKSFEGIVLRSRIDYSSVKTDTVVKKYSKEADRNAPDEKHLTQSKRQYQKSLIQELFGFKAVRKQFELLLRVFLEHERALSTAALKQVQALGKDLDDLVFTIAEKFEPKLAVYLAQSPLPEANEQLQSRIKKASLYFVDKITNVLQPALHNITALADSQSVQKQAVERITNLKRALFIKKASFQALQNGFVVQEYVKAKTNADLDFEKAKNTAPPKSVVTKVPADAPNPELYAELLSWREDLAVARDVNGYEIISLRSIREIAEFLPTQKTTLKKIKGIGSAKMKQFGEEIVEMVERYCEAKGVPSDLSMTTRKDTKRISFELFQAGKSIEAIAKERKLAESTIETHLAYFVKEGVLGIAQLLEKPDLTAIIDYFTTANSMSVTDAKMHFGNKYSYNILKMVRNQMGDD